MSRKTKTLPIIRLNCLCLQHVLLDLHGVKFVSPNGFGDGLFLSEVTTLLQRYRLCSNTDCNNKTETSSICECWKVMESSAGTAVETSNKPWWYVSSSDKDQMLE